MMWIVLGILCAGQEARWSTLAVTCEPTARHESAMVEVGGKFYLLGGRGVKPVEEFDPATKSWRKLGLTPIEIHHFQPVAYGNQIYVMTAMTGKYPKETPLSNIHIYDPMTDAWRVGPEIPKRRRRGGAGTVVHNGKIYVVGGIVDGHTSGTVAWFDEFDPKNGKWRELANAPRVRDHFPAITLGDRLYCIGGRDTSFHEPGNFMAFFGAVIPEVDRYDFSTDKWTTLAEKLPIATAAGGLVELRRHIYSFGGESAQKTAHTETQRLDLNSGKWELLAPIVQGHHGGGSAVIGGNIYFAAGSGGQGGSPELSSTEVYAIEK